MLNEFIFSDLQLQIIPDGPENNIRRYLPQSLLEDQRGSAFSIGIFYLHLAEFLELPIYLTNHKSFCLLKWIRPAGSKFIDLSQNGLILNESHLLQLFNKKDEQICDSVDYLEILPGKKVVITYLEKILNCLTNEFNYKKILALYNVLLELSPNDMTYILNRALTKKAMGFHQEALLDFKKYFSFMEKKEAPKNIKLAYYESKALCQKNESSVH